MSAPTPIDPSEAAALVASQRWKSKVRVAEDGCWLWTASLSSTGYGSIWLGGRPVKAHRVALVAAMGRDLHPGMVVDHICRTRICVRPDHLHEVTTRENIFAPGSLAIAADQAGRTHCPRGHRLEGDNLVPSNLARGWRRCQTCHRSQAREQHALIREAHQSLGISRRAYGATYGWSRATAERLLGEAAHGSQ